MSNVRIVKKYPNRRLYDTAISSYITLDDVKRLVMDGVSFQVLDARSGDDLTRTILLQIISEQEGQGDPIFSTELLAHIIRFYGDSLQGLMGRFLEQSLRGFVGQQKQLREQFDSVGKLGKGISPLAVMTDMAEQNMRLWRGVQDGFKKPGQRRVAAVEDNSGEEGSETKK